MIIQIGIMFHGINQSFFIVTSGRSTRITVAVAVAVAATVAATVTGSVTVTNLMNIGLQFHQCFCNRRRITLLIDPCIQCREGRIGTYINRCPTMLLLIARIGMLLLLRYSECIIRCR
jgi:hypothetical protein